MASPSLLRRFLLGTSLAIAALVSACGARGPLDIIVVEESAPDASAEAGAHVDAAGEASSEAGDAPSEAKTDAIEAAVDSSTGADANPIVACGTCLAQTCGTQLLTCVTSSGCIAALQCVATMCLTGGTPDIQCLGNCTNGDAMTQQQLLSVLGCVLGNCPTCTSALGGLGGLGGGGGGGGAGG
jgi:hypothetical protein